MKKEPISVLVFKDNYSARSFSIPIGWFNRFGILLGILVISTLMSTIAAGWYFWKTRTLGPGKVQDLEEEVDDLRAKLLAAQNSAKSQAQSSALLGVNSMTPSGSATSATSARLAAPYTSPPAAAVPAAPLAPNPPLVAINPAAGSPIFFGSLPLLKTGQALPDPTKLPFKLSPIHTQWQDHTLKLKFSIQYVANDGGNQTGRIIVLARGPQVLMGYPSGLFETSAADSIIDHTRGEYFAVSRFREVQADLEPLESADSIREVDALILNQAGQVLFIEHLAIPKGQSSSTVSRKAAPPVRKALTPVTTAHKTEAPSEEIARPASESPVPESSP